MVAQRKPGRVGVGGVPSFRATLSWDDRIWNPIERYLWAAATGSSKLALATALLLLPLLVLSIPIMPLLLVAQLRSPPSPRGAWANVGVSDVQQRIDAVDATLRVRAFYPASAPPTKWRFGARSWLPSGPAASRYAAAHIRYGVPLPQRVANFLSTFLGAALLLARLPGRVSRGAPAAAAPQPEGWPLVVFSHGLYGSSAGYSALCSEIASHGAVVLAMEHKDGSAIYSETDDGDASGYQFGQDTSVQTERRVTELRGVVACAQQVASLAHEGLQVNARSVSLVGHSFGAATALCAAAEMQRGGARSPQVRGVLALDPWIKGFDAESGQQGAPAAPTLACLTQSMFYPENERALGAVLRSIAARTPAQPVLYTEALGTRHQEVSDYPSLQYWPMRLMCMCGGQPPHASFRQQSSVAVGFLAAVGVLASRGGDGGGGDGSALEQERALVSCMLLQALQDKPMAAEHDDVDGWHGQYHVHDSALPAQGVQLRTDLERWAIPRAPLYIPPRSPRVALAKAAPTLV